MLVWTSLGGRSSLQRRRTQLSSSMLRLIAELLLEQQPKKRLQSSKSKPATNRLCFTVSISRCASRGRYHPLLAAFCDNTFHVLIDNAAQLAARLTRLTAGGPPCPEGALHDCHTAASGDARRTDEEGHRCGPQVRSCPTLPAMHRAPTLPEPRARSL